MKFMYEYINININNCLAFLDVLVTRETHFVRHYITTFSGL